MHPLRFPNSGIKAKVFVRKIGFKLRVMRLYHVESFYAFFLYFRSEDSEEEGRQATASPHTRPATHGQGQPARGGHPLGLQPAGAALAGTAGCCQPARAIVARSAAPAKGKVVGWRAQVAAARDAPARGAAACDQPARGCRPRLALSPVQVQRRRRRRGRQGEG
ncbi:hypothetical protein GW17_00049356 [Ensete ventricosum]|nr:hypothetical protein GW17_00049356 [Ensete ventricosum]